MKRSQIYRFTNIIIQAKSRVEQLETSINQAQTREGQMVEMSQWMTEMTSLLQSRLDADILAGEVPKEYDVSTETLLPLAIMSKCSGVLHKVGHVCFHLGINV